VLAAFPFVLPDELELRIAIPADPSLAGRELLLQALVGDLRPIAGTFSNCATLRIRSIR
jgi:hypothetical protein